MNITKKAYLKSIAILKKYRNIINNYYGFYFRFILHASECCNKVKY